MQIKSNLKNYHPHRKPVINPLTQRSTSIINFSLLLFFSINAAQAEIIPIDNWDDAVCAYKPEWQGTVIHIPSQNICHVILQGEWKSPPADHQRMSICLDWSSGHSLIYTKCSIGCPDDMILNSNSGTCEKDGINNDSGKGSPNIPGDNAPPSCTGNPINSAIGNKYQPETDYSQQAQGALGLSFARVYNSLDGKWRHSYSTQLGITSSLLVLIHADGRQALFARSGSITTPAAPEKGTLKLESSGWVYTSPTNEKLLFNSSGRLTRRKWPSGYFQALTYSGTYNRTITITDSLGQALTVTEDALHQPLTLTADGVSIAYGYSADGKQLQTVTKNQNGQTLVRRYHYEDPRNPKLLTGITDERGIRYAT
ncbi:DUF6531 domain-containing protein [Pseudomonas indica]|uniref:DUF6531 domain-containing protein n=1 Tax=Pseudomonas indica TaxID=137658 RepID=UPI0023F7CFAC|nr:DUF6531 domain-containing protein [Pseudomonas indica]